MSYSCTSVSYSCTSVSYSCTSVSYSCTSVSYSCTSVSYSCTSVSYSCMFYPFYRTLSKVCWLVRENGRGLLERTVSMYTDEHLITVSKCTIFIELMAKTVKGSFSKGPQIIVWLERTCASILFLLFSASQCSASNFQLGCSLPCTSL